MECCGLCDCDSLAEGWWSCDRESLVAPPGTEFVHSEISAWGFHQWATTSGYGSSCWLVADGSELFFLSFSCWLPPRQQYFSYEGEKA